MKCPGLLKDVTQLNKHLNWTLPEFIAKPDTDSNGLIGIATSSFTRPYYSPRIIGHRNFNIFKELHNINLFGEGMLSYAH